MFSICLTNCTVRPIIRVVVFLVNRLCLLIFAASIAGQLLIASFSAISSSALVPLSREAYAAPVNVATVRGNQTYACLAVLSFVAFCWLSLELYGGLILTQHHFARNIILRPCLGVRTELQARVLHVSHGVYR